MKVKVDVYTEQKQLEKQFGLTQRLSAPDQPKSGFSC